ncbi:MAG: S1C family serine protease [Nitrospiraceae bacterium]
MGIMQLLTVFIVLGCWVFPAQSSELTPRQIYEQTSPAVVMVMGHGDGSRRGSGGTGSIIDRDGLVLTNAHVVIEESTGKPFPRLTVFLKPDQVTGESKTDLARGVKAKVVAFSRPLDLALLKLDGAPAPLPVLDVSESESTVIGDRVVAIGHPEQGGLWTLTTGVISAQFENFNGTKGKHVFQTETGLNRGNSGGPLLDTQGHMIGVNTAIARVASDGLPIISISFSLKSSVARKWLQEQGVGGRGTPRRPDMPSTGHVPTLPPAPISSMPQEKPTAPVITGPPPPSPTPRAPSPSQVSPPPRPYNLDKLISERSRAEAELEDMIKEMRGKFQGR